MFGLSVAGVLLVLNRFLVRMRAGLRAVKALLRRGLSKWRCGWWCADGGILRGVCVSRVLAEPVCGANGARGMGDRASGTGVWAGHGYQGMKGMIYDCHLWAMFWDSRGNEQKFAAGDDSARGQDIFSGIVGSALARKNYF